MVYADVLSDEYRDGLRELREQRDALKKKVESAEAGDIPLEELKKLEANQRDVTLIGGMISDMEYAIKWLDTAREPGMTREISNRSRYQRTELWGDIDILSMQAYLNQQSEVEAPSMTLEQENHIAEILDVLTVSEYEAYTSIVRDGLTYQQASDYMDVTRSTVQSLVNRAKNKIQKELEKGCSQTILF